MSKKKLLTLFLSLGLVASLALTGCGDVSDKIPQNEASQNLGTIIEREDDEDLYGNWDEFDSYDDVVNDSTKYEDSADNSGVITLENIPEYSGEPYVIINDNVPYFEDNEITTDVFENYAPLDNLGRCGVAYANICKELMPTEDREGISNVKPSGWINKPYDFVDGKYIYNRCHLIGFQLAGENANKLNLITGTRYMNVIGMLPFENMIDDYVDETNNHVLYRVTPIYDGDNLVASGVLMEAYSVEDEGEGILFNVYCYNIQPGCEIDYATGDSWLADEKADNNEEKETYILNTNSKKFHKEGCSNADTISKENKEEYTGDRDDLIKKGYSPCGSCKP